MGNSALIGGWQVFRKPLHELVHGGHLVGFGRQVLLGPTGYLPCHIAFRTAIIPKADLVNIHRVQCCQGVDSRPMGRHPLLTIQRPQRRVVDYAAFQKVHDVERRTDNIAVFTKRPGGWYRHVGVLEQGTHDLVFPFHHVGGGQRFSGRLFAQHVLAAVGVQQKRGVRLSALELLYVQLGTETWYGLL